MILRAHAGRDERSRAGGGKEHSRVECDFGSEVEGEMSRWLTVYELEFSSSGDERRFARGSEEPNTYESEQDNGAERNVEQQPSNSREIIHSAILRGITVELKKQSFRVCQNF